MIELTVKQFMQTQLPTIMLSTELSQAITLLEKSNLTSSPVVDSNNTVVGFITHHELLKPLLHASYHCDASLTVQDVLSSHQPVSVKTDDRLVDIAQQMLASKPKSYPVLDSKHKLAGIITRAHVVKALAGAYNQCHYI